VHTPEFVFERDVANVATAVRELLVRYPVAVDSRYAIWKAFGNEYWPAHYVIDAGGIVRHHQVGEGKYEETEQVIQRLLHEANATKPVERAVSVKASGARAPSELADVRSPETYVGYERQQNFVSARPLLRDRPARYTVPTPLRLNEWGLQGRWNVGDERALMTEVPGGLMFRFHARDLHLVLGRASTASPIRFRVRLDGSAPLGNRGSDVDADGRGVVGDSRLYQLIRQTGPIEDRTFEIEFSDPGVEVFAFTFG
jgi:hypothetical protein